MERTKFIVRNYLGFQEFLITVWVTLVNTAWSNFDMRTWYCASVKGAIFLSCSVSHLIFLCYNKKTAKQIKNKINKNK